MLLKSPADHIPRPSSTRRANITASPASPSGYRAPDEFNTQTSAAKIITLRTRTNKRLASASLSEKTRLKRRLENIAALENFLNTNPQTTLQLIKGWHGKDPNHHIGKSEFDTFTITLEDKTSITWKLDSSIGLIAQSNRFSDAENPQNSLINHGLYSSTKETTARYKDLEIKGDKAREKATKLLCSTQDTGNSFSPINDYFEQLKTIKESLTKHKKQHAQQIIPKLTELINTQINQELDSVKTPSNLKLDFFLLKKKTGDLAKLERAIADQRVLQSSVEYLSKCNNKYTNRNKDKETAIKDLSTIIFLKGENANKALGLLVEISPSKCKALLKSMQIESKEGQFNYILKHCSSHADLSEYLSRLEPSEVKPNILGLLEANNHLKYNYLLQIIHVLSRDHGDEPLKTLLLKLKSFSQGLKGKKSKLLVDLFIFGSTQAASLDNVPISVATVDYKTGESRLLDTWYETYEEITLPNGMDWDSFFQQEKKAFIDLKETNRGAPINEAQLDPRKMRLALIDFKRFQAKKIMKARQEKELMQELKTSTRVWFSLIDAKTGVSSQSTFKVSDKSTFIRKKAIPNGVLDRLSFLHARIKSDPNDPDSKKEIQTLLTTLNNKAAELDAPNQKKLKTITKLFNESLHLTNASQEINRYYISMIGRFNSEDYKRTINNAIDTATQPEDKETKGTELKANLPLLLPTNLRLISQGEQHRVKDWERRLNLSEGACFDFKSVDQKELNLTCMGKTYRVEKTLGSGQFGRVLQVKNDKAQPRAIKIIIGERGNIIDRDKIQNEYTLHTRLDHPNIARMDSLGLTEDTVDDNGFHTGMAMMVMEYIDGKPSDDLKLDRPTILTISTQVKDALTHMHAKDIFHRDIKPENIMIIQNEDGSYTVKLIDFGEAVTPDTLEDPIAGSEPQKHPGLNLIDLKGKSRDSKRSLLKKADYYSLAASAYDLKEGKVGAFQEMCIKEALLAEKKPADDNAIQAYTNPAPNSDNNDYLATQVQNSSTLWAIIEKTFSNKLPKVWELIKEESPFSNL